MSHLEAVTESNLGLYSLDEFPHECIRRIREEISKGYLSDFNLTHGLETINGFESLLREGGMDFQMCSYFSLLFSEFFEIEKGKTPLFDYSHMLLEVTESRLISENLFDQYRMEFVEDPIEYEPFVDSFQQMFKVAHHSYVFDLNDLNRSKIHSILNSDPNPDRVRLFSFFYSTNEMMGIKQFVYSKVAQFVEEQDDVLEEGEEFLEVHDVNQFRDEILKGLEFPKDQGINMGRLFYFIQRDPKARAPIDLERMLRAA